jgi:hypothetical protein
MLRPLRCHLETLGDLKATISGTFRLLRGHAVALIGHGTSGYSAVLHQAGGIEARMETFDNLQCSYNLDLENLRRGYFLSHLERLSRLCEFYSLAFHQVGGFLAES